MTQRKYSILHLVSSERWTGVADPVIATARKQSEWGHKVWLACIGGYTFEEQARAQGIEILTTLTMDRRLYIPNLYGDYKKLRRLVLENNIDVIHTHLLHDHWMAAMALRGLPRRHLLLRTMHRYDWPRRDLLHKWLFCRRTDHLMTTSEAMKKRIVGRLRLPPDRVDVIFGGVETYRFHPDCDGEALRREFGIPPDAPVAGIVARLRDGRGHDWLLRVFPRVLEEIPQAHLLIVGRGELKYPLRERIARMEARERIHMTGYRSDDLPEAYAAMDCALFLGQGSEGTCRAILEAMSSGRPVVGVDDGGVAEIIRDGVTGHVAAKDSEAALCEAMVSVLGDRDKARAMGAAARRQCLERFTEDARARAVLDAYDRTWQWKYPDQ